MTDDLDPRAQRDATDLLALAHASWQDGRWSDALSLADRVAARLSGTPAYEASLAYRDSLTAITAARASGAVSKAASEDLAEQMLIAWQHLRAALLP